MRDKKRTGADVPFVLVDAPGDGRDRLPRARGRAARRRGRVCGARAVG